MLKRLFAVCVALFAFAALPAIPVKADTLQVGDTSHAVCLLEISSSDHLTGLTGATVTVTISKNGGAYASPSGAVTEIANGLYKFVPSGTDTGTLGQLWIHATATGADPLDKEIDIVSWNPFTTSAGTLLQYGTGTGQLNPDGSGNATISGTPAVNVSKWNGTTVATPATAGIPDVNVKNINNIATTPVTTVKAIQGLTTPDTITTYTGNTPQTGDSFGLIGTAGVGLTNLGDTRIGHLNADMTSRMATYTQPIGFLAATFPGTVSSYAGADTSGTTTLLTRIPQTVLFDGGGNVKSIVWAYNTGEDPGTLTWGASTRTLSAFAFTPVAASITGITLPAVVPSLTQMQGGLPTDASVATDTQTGLTAQGLTTTRAAYLDNLNGIAANVAAAVLGSTIDGTITMKQQQELGLAIMNGKYHYTTSGTATTTLYYKQDMATLLATSVADTSTGIRTWTFSGAW